MNVQKGQTPEILIDRPYTIQATVIGLVLGLVVAVIVGYLLLSFSQPLTLGDGGKVNWTAGAFMLPIAGLVSTVVLGAGVFYLPVRLARRRGVALDPHIWPAAGTIAIAVIVVIAFIGAILVGII